MVTTTATAEKEAEVSLHSEDDDHDAVIDTFDNEKRHSSLPTVTLTGDPHDNHAEEIKPSTSNISRQSQASAQQQAAAAAADQPMVSCLTGMHMDLKARIPLYGSDWALPKSGKSLFKILNAILFAFVVQLIPGLIFAELLDRSTNGSLAVPEVLLSAGIIGIIYAILSGQPLVLLGITGYE